MLKERPAVEFLLKDKKEMAFVLFPSQKKDVALPEIAIFGKDGKTPFVASDTSLVLEIKWAGKTYRITRDFSSSTVKLEK